MELASESLAAIPRICIICNTEISAKDVKTVRMAVGDCRKELEEGLLRLTWNIGHFPHLVKVHGGADTDWEGTAEVLNQTEAFRELLEGW